jgi:hypothetical protein
MYPLPVATRAFHVIVSELEDGEDKKTLKVNVSKHKVKAGENIRGGSMHELMVETKGVLTRHFACPSPCNLCGEVANAVRDDGLAFT